MGNAHPRNRASRKQDAGSQTGEVNPEKAHAKASAGGNEIGIRHIPLNKKSPFRDFSYFTFS